jgi:L-alanine-DL-glutamate epimerase-like enolase superfamily enzyme
LALWDWLAKREGVSVTRLALGTEVKPVTSFATIGLCSPKELEEKLAELHGFPRIKIKSDANEDLTPVEQTRKARPDALIAVDANCAWRPKHLAPLALACSQLQVAFIEQPFAPAKDGDLLRNSLPLPIFADESCVLEDKVSALAGHFDGINVKLVKCGGLTPALRMLRRSKRLALQSMVGCMLESTVLIAAGCVAAQIADFADLDGAWLIANDPFTGWTFARGVLTPSSTPGLGVEPLHDFF